jgi:hypothetical protein
VSVLANGWGEPLTSMGRSTLKIFENKGGLIVFL